MKKYGNKTLSHFSTKPQDFDSIKSFGVDDAKDVHAIGEGAWFKAFGRLREPYEHLICRQASSRRYRLAKKLRANAAGSARSVVIFVVVDNGRGFIAGWESFDEVCRWQDRVVIPENDAWLLIGPLRDMDTYPHGRPIQTEHAGDEIDRAVNAWESVLGVRANRERVERHLAEIRKHSEGGPQMGITKQDQLEQADKEQAAADREHARGCDKCRNELSREDCEALEHALSQT